MTRREKISVIMPVFNGEKFIEESIQSVLSQTYKNFELLIVDDGSTDRSAEIAFEYSRKDGRVKVVQHTDKKNHGVSASRALGVGKAEGFFIAFCDTDDVWKEQKLEKQVTVFNDHDDVVLCHTACTAFGVNKEFCRRFEMAHNLSDDPMKYRLSRMDHFLQYNRICNSTVMVNAAAVKNIHFSFDQAFQYEDWILWILLSKRGSFYYSGERLVKYRNHEGSSTSRIRHNRKKIFYAKLEVFLVVFKKFPGAGIRTRLKIIYKFLQTLYYLFRTY